MTLLIAEIAFGLLERYSIMSGATIPRALPARSKSRALSSSDKANVFTRTSSLSAEGGLRRPFSISHTQTEETPKLLAISTCLKERHSLNCRRYSPNTTILQPFVQLAIQLISSQANYITAFIRMQYKTPAFFTDVLYISRKGFNLCFIQMSQHIEPRYLPNTSSILTPPLSSICLH